MNNAKGYYEFVGTSNDNQVIFRFNIKSFKNFPGFCPRRLFSQAYRCYDADNGNSKGSLEGIQGYVVYDMYYNA